MLPLWATTINGKQWIANNAIESMVISSYNMLDEKYAENEDKFHSSKQQSFEGFQSKFETEDKDLMKQIKTEVDMMVLNGAN